MDKETPVAHMTPAQFREHSLEQAKETLRIAPVFRCMACREHKDRPDAAGAFIWEPRPGPLAKMKMRGVPIYNLCRECKEKDPNIVYHQVAKGFLEVGLFGDVPTEEGKQLLGMS